MRLRGRRDNLHAAKALFPRLKPTTPSGGLDEALRPKEAGEARVILFNLSGHGHFDMAASMPISLASSRILISCRGRNCGPGASAAGSQEYRGKRTSMICSLRLGDPSCSLSLYLSPYVFLEERGGALPRSVAAFSVVMGGHIVEKRMLRIRIVLISCRI